MSTGISLSIEHLRNRYGISANLVRGSNPSPPIFSSTICGHLFVMRMADLFLWIIVIYFYCVYGYAGQITSVHVSLKGNT